jgi:hypothetical protein
MFLYTMISFSFLGLVTKSQSCLSFSSVLVALYKNQARARSFYLFGVRIFIKDSASAKSGESSLGIDVAIKPTD